MMRRKMGAHFVLIKRNDEPLYREWGLHGRSYDNLAVYSQDHHLPFAGKRVLWGKIESNLIRPRLVSDSACAAVSEH